MNLADYFEQKGVLSMRKQNSEERIGAGQVDVQNGDRRRFNIMGILIDGHLRRTGLLLSEVRFVPGIGALPTRFECGFQEVYRGITEKGWIIRGIERGFNLGSLLDNPTAAADRIASDNEDIKYVVSVNFNRRMADEHKNKTISKRDLDCEITASALRCLSGQIPRSDMLLGNITETKWGTEYAFGHYRYKGLFTKGNIAVERKGIEISGEISRYGQTVKEIRVCSYHVGTERMTMELLKTLHICVREFHKQYRETFEKFGDNV